MRSSDAADWFLGIVWRREHVGALGRNRPLLQNRPNFLGHRDLAPCGSSLAKWIEDCTLDKIEISRFDAKNFLGAHSSVQHDSSNLTKGFAGSSQIGFFFFWRNDSGPPRL